MMLTGKFVQFVAGNMVVKIDDHEFHCPIGLGAQIFLNGQESPMSAIRPGDTVEISGKAYLPADTIVATRA